MRVYVALLLAALGLVLVWAGVNGSAEQLFTSVFGRTPAKSPKLGAAGPPVVPSQIIAGTAPGTGPNPGSPVQGGHLAPGLIGATG